MNLTVEELQTRLRNTEDPFVERKSAHDLKDALKTAIAFANTLPNGIPGVLFMPVRDDGRVEQGLDLDNLQRKVSEQIDRAYPAIIYFQQVLSGPAGDCVAVTVWGSPARPHFAGPSYIRDGSQTRIASEKQFDALVARRVSKVEELTGWVGKEVTVVLLTDLRTGGPRLMNNFDGVVREVNQWWVSLDVNGRRESYVLRRAEFAWDHEKNRLTLEISFR